MTTHLIFLKPTIIYLKSVFWEQIEDKVNSRCFILKGLQISAARQLKQWAYPSYSMYCVVCIGGSQ